MAFRAPFRCAFICAVAFCLLANAHASYQLYISLNGDYPGHIMPSHRPGRPGQPNTPQQTLFPCTSFAFLAPPVQAGASPQRIVFSATSSSDLSKVTVPKNVNKVVVDRVRDSYSSQFATACQQKDTFGMVALSYQGVGSNASVPIRAFTLQMARITSITQYTSVRPGHPPTRMEELTLTFELISDTAHP